MSAPPSLCDDWQISKKFVKQRGKHLLESGIWSDCRFIVGAEPNQVILEGHKLFLAMASPVFEVMFFGGMAETDPVAILDVQPEAFKALLEYIYTDKINLTSFDQACELCYAAKKYMLPFLVEECTNYLWSDIHPKNACRAFEFAKLFEEPRLMLKSIKIIREKTHKILTGPSFEELELGTILTIFDQDELNIGSELELFSAINRYAIRHSLVSGQTSAEETSSNTHPTIRDAIKKIRFLTLVPKQFAEGPGTSTLLTESEKFTILMNICSDNSGSEMPEGFSNSRIPRRKIGGDVTPNAQNGVSYTALLTLNRLANEVYDAEKRIICVRSLLRTNELMNHSVLDCAVTFQCDKNICLYGIQVPAQITMDDELEMETLYPELLYAHLLDSEGCRLTYTHFSGRVAYHSLIDIFFNRPVYLQKNKLYKVGLVLNKVGWYPMGEFSNFSLCNGVTFSFSRGQGADVGSYVSDGLIRSLIFAYNSRLSEISQHSFNIF